MIALILAAAAAMMPVSHHDMTLHAADGRAVPVRVFAPDKGCHRCALIIFSHGVYSDYEHYDALLEDWAAHGYVVAAPLHVDSGEHPEHARYSVPDGRLLRLADIAAVDAAFRPGAPGLLQGVSFSQKMFMAGHSYGALIAEIVGGARLDGDAEGRLSRSWRTPVAVAAISPPGPIAGFVTAPGWAAISRPTLFVTGTTDVLPVYFDSYQLHLASYRAAPARFRHVLVFKGMDHSFNGAFWQTAPAGARPAPAVARLNAKILAFFGQAARGR